MITRIFRFVKENQDDIILVIGVVLISLLSFAAGYLYAKEQLKQPLQIEDQLNYTSEEQIF